MVEDVEDVISGLRWAASSSGHLHRAKEEVSVTWNGMCQIWTVLWVWYIR